MRKRHLNSSSTTHNTLYHLQKGLDGTRISVVPLRRTGEGLKCIRSDYIKEKNPSRKGVSIEKLEKRELSIKL